MSLANKLALLETKGVFATGVVTKRWGQLLRESPTIAGSFRRLVEDGTLVPLHSLGKIHSGVVTRANAYFIVRELPFDQIPKRFNLTKRDLARVAVVMDGLETPHQIERQFLKAIIKGPEALLAPSVIESSAHLLFDVDVSVQELRELHAAGAIAYVRRGETVSYNVSEDTLKGGVPAERSQVRNRKPHWYSLHPPKVNSPRLLLPEHFDKRFLVGCVPASDTSVVIDTLYTFTPNRADEAEFIWASLNTLLTWYQIELRGRTQHGEGVLKVKIPDYGGILVANPSRIVRREARSLVEEFRQLSAECYSNCLDIVSQPGRVAFDELYLKCAKWPTPPNSRLVLERWLRAAIGERQERKTSVAEAKIDRRRSVDGTASVDAFATRIVAGVSAYPDPRRFVNPSSQMGTVPINGAVGPRLTVGTELFNQGEVYSGQVVIARAPNMTGAQFVRGVLQHDPELGQVEVPTEPELTRVMTRWKAAITEWQVEFDRTAEATTRGLVDARLVESIKRRALGILRIG